MGSQDWDIIGQGTASLTKITAVVKKAEGDKYVTSSLVLSFIEFPVSSAHESIKAARMSIRQEGGSQI